MGVLVALILAVVVVACDSDPTGPDSNNPVAVQVVRSAGAGADEYVNCTNFQHDYYEQELLDIWCPGTDAGKAELLRLIDIHEEAGWDCGSPHLREGGPRGPPPPQWHVKCSRDANAPVALAPHSGRRTVLASSAEVALRHGLDPRARMV